MAEGLDTRDVTMIRLIVGATVLLCLTVSAYAQEGSKQMFSWTDENGVVHFSDQRPSGREVTVIDIPASSEPQSGINLPPPGEEPEDNQAGSTERLSPAEKKRREMAKRREEILAAREKNERECSEARTELAKIEPNRRVYFTNEEGEVERMDDVVRTDRVAAVKKFIEDNCQ